MLSGMNFFPLFLGLTSTRLGVINISKQLEHFRAIYITKQEVEPRYHINSSIKKPCLNSSPFRKRNRAGRFKIVFTANVRFKLMFS